MAWHSLRFQPESALTIWDRERTRDGHGRNRKRLIIALAPALVAPAVGCGGRLATDGVVPDGAIIH